LAVTERIRVAIGLMPTPLRNVALTAMEIATLARLFPGRFIPGIGHGVQPWMAQVGARAESPLTLLREYAVALTALLTGEEVTQSGRYVHLDQVQLGWPPDPVPPLYGGAVGPKSLAVIGELCDGAILDWATADQLRATRAIIDPLSAAAGRGRLPLVTTLIAATGPGAAERVRAEQGRWDLEPGGPTGLGGSPGEIATAVRSLADAGATTVVLQPTQDEPDLVGFVSDTAAAVATLLGR
jgi:alkanesulfonate monooxygenase SsuD/methylene tetrahydromethanopterin reductase-like flavin-dependent oxidoreductase (luciferase family)